jgi:hypothetical protein
MRKKKADFAAYSTGLFIIVDSHPLQWYWPVLGTGIAQWYSVGLRAG